MVMKYMGNEPISLVDSKFTELYYKKISYEMHAHINLVYTQICIACTALLHISKRVCCVKPFSSLKL